MQHPDALARGRGNKHKPNHVMTIKWREMITLIAIRSVNYREDTLFSFLSWLSEVILYAEGVFKKGFMYYNTIKAGIKIVYLKTSGLKEGLDRHPPPF